MPIPTAGGASSLSLDSRRTERVAEVLEPFSVLPDKLTPVLHYDGTPITARFIHGEISQRLKAFNVTPMKRTAAGTGG